MFPNELDMLQRIRAHVLATMPDIDPSILDYAINQKIELEAQAAENKIKLQLVVEMAKMTMNPLYMKAAQAEQQQNYLAKQEGTSWKTYKTGVGKIVNIIGKPEDSWTPLEDTIAGAPGDSFKYAQLAHTTLPPDPEDYVEPKCVCGGSGGADGKIDPNIHAAQCPAWKITGVTTLASGEVVSNVDLYGPAKCDCSNMQIIKGKHNFKCPANLVKCNCGTQTQKHLSTCKVFLTNQKQCNCGSLTDAHLPSCVLSPYSCKHEMAECDQFGTVKCKKCGIVAGDGDGGESKVGPYEETKKCAKCERDLKVVAVSAGSGHTDFVWQHLSKEDLNKCNKGVKKDHVPLDEQFGTEPFFHPGYAMQEPYGLY